MQILQELGDDDPTRKLQFSDIMTTRISVEFRTIQKIYFSDECIFHLNGHLSNLTLNNCH